MNRTKPSVNNSVNHINMYPTWRPSVNEAYNINKRPLKMFQE